MVSIFKPTNGFAAQWMATRRQFIGQVMLATTSATVLRAADRPNWIIGCYTRPWGKFDFRVAFDGIADAGFKYVGIMTAKGGWLVTPDTPPEKVAMIRAEAKSRGLSIASLSGGAFMVRKSLPEGIARLKRLIDCAVICGSPGLLLGGTGDPALAEDYYLAIGECCDYAASKGVGLSLKPHGPANSTGQLCRLLIEKVGHKNLGLWYDPGNVFYYSDGTLDPVDDAATVDGLVVGMSIKDFLPPKVITLTPGTGKVDFPKVMARLRRGGFHGGPLIVEALAVGDAAHLAAEARKAHQFVSAIST